MSAPKSKLGRSINELSPDNYPSNIKTFKASSWDHALDQLESALINEGKQSATFFLDDGLPYEELENIRKVFFKNVHENAPFNENYRAREENLTSSHTASLIKYLSPDARSCFDALARRVASLTVIQRYQMRAPKETSVPHFDFPNFGGIQRTDLPNRTERFLKGRNIRLIFSEVGGGPILFGPSKDELIVGDFETGAIENTIDLGDAWQAKGRTLTAITGQQDWAEQAIPHASPPHKLSRESFRALTVYDINR